MGRSLIPMYRLEFDDGTRNVQAWRGRASVVALEEWITAYVKSLSIGGVNEHISRTLGYIPFPRTAKIVRQKDNVIVAEWHAGMFHVY